MSARVEFRLSMPARNSWNGGWSGEGSYYGIVRKLPDANVRMLVDDGLSWYHRWDDGWGALITARVLHHYESPPKSDGFAGYDWMVDNIIGHGSPYAKSETVSSLSLDGPR